MSRIEVFDIRDFSRSLAAGLLVTALALTVLAPADAQRRNNDDEQQVEGRVLSTEVGEVVLEANDALANESYQQVLNLLNPLLAGNLEPYERSVVLRLRGNARFNLDDYNGTIQDFLGAINTGTLVTDEIIALRTNIG